MRGKICLFCLLLLTPLGRGDYSLRFDDTVILPGDTAAVPVMVRTDTPIHGFSLAFSYPGTVFTVAGFAINDALVDPEAVTYDALLDRPEDNYAIIGQMLVWDATPFGSGFPATEAEEQCLGWLLLATDKQVQPDTYTVLPMNAVGDPKVDNVFSSAGQSHLPSLAAGTVTIENRNVMRIRPAYSRPGMPLKLFIEVDHRQPLAGLQLAISYDATKLRLRTDDPEEEDLCERALSPCDLDVESMLAPHDIEQFLLTVERDYVPGRDRASCVMIFDYALPFEDQVMAPGRKQTVLAAYFDVSPDVAPGETTEVRLEDGLGTPPFDNKFFLPVYSDANKIVEMASIFPLKEDGVVEFSLGKHAFRRGFINDDDQLDLADAIYALGVIMGLRPAPACLSSVDINDDGTVNLADPISLLVYLFVESDGIPAPFEACGVDPTPDNLPCYEPTPDC